MIPKDPADPSDPAAGEGSIGPLLSALDGLTGSRTMPAIGAALAAVRAAHARHEGTDDAIALGRAGALLATALQGEGARLLAREAADAERLVASIARTLADEPAWLTYRHFVDIECPRLRQAGIDPGLPGDDGGSEVAGETVLAAIDEARARYRRWQDERAAERMVQHAYGFASIPDPDGPEPPPTGPARTR